MKDKRNCGVPYPIYQAPIAPMNMMGSPIPYQMQGYPQQYQPNPVTSNTIETQINTLQQQIDQLEQRVNRLEGGSGTNANKYNNSNYYMV